MIENQISNFWNWRFLLNVFVVMYDDKFTLFWRNCNYVIVTIQFDSCCLPTSDPLFWDPMCNLWMWSLIPAPANQAAIREPTVEHGDYTHFRISIEPKKNGLKLPDPLPGSVPVWICPKFSECVSLCPFCGPILVRHRKEWSRRVSIYRAQSSHWLPVLPAHQWFYMYVFARI